MQKKDKSIQKMIDFLLEFPHFGNNLSINSQNVLYSGGSDEASVR